MSEKADEVVVTQFVGDIAPLMESIEKVGAALDHLYARVHSLRPQVMESGGPWYVGRGYAQPISQESLNEQRMTPGNPYRTFPTLAEAQAYLDGLNDSTNA